MSLNKNLVFIASGGRTGTQFLGDFLSRVIEDCLSEHEADMFAGFSKLTARRIKYFGLWHMVIGRALGQTGLRAAGTQYLTGSKSLDDLASRMRDQRLRYHANAKHSLIIESYSRWWMFAGEIGAIWSGAKTVGIVRDPRHWIASWLAHNVQRGGGSWSRHWPTYFPPGPLTPERVGDIEWAERWQEIGHVGRLAWEWRETNRRLVEGEKSDPDMQVFRFEDIFHPGHPEMQRLIDFVCSHENRTYNSQLVDGFTQSKRNASSAEKYAWRDWSTEDRRLVDEICGPLMQHFGYEKLGEQPARERRQAG